MLRLCRWIALAVVVLAPLSVRAQDYCPQVAVAPTVAYYAPAPTVAYYAPPPVVAYAPPTVAYAPPVVAYAPPVAAPVTVSSYRYGLFGRRGVTTVTYGAPGVVVAPRRAFYSPGVVYYP